MSYVFDGKISNQSPCLVGFNKKVKCSKCNKFIKPPTKLKLAHTELKRFFFCYTYIYSSYYIYETKSGNAVLYCSDYCRRKHNHRFNR